MRDQEKRRVSETADWSTAEGLEDHLEGIGMAPEETLHGLDQLYAALADEGDDFEGLEDDEIEAALALRTDET